MAKDLFSVSIFFIIFRETIEAAIIVSVLLSFVEQLMSSGQLAPRSGPAIEGNEEDGETVRVKRIIRRMRIQIWAGAATGLFIALCIGGAFIAVFYTKLSDLWAKSEQLWEGIFSIIAAILIYVMGLAFLKMDRSRVKWRIKLAQAFDNKVSSTGLLEDEKPEEAARAKKEARNGKWALFLLPFITVLREGVEAVVFVGGVSLGQSGTSIPIATIVGLIAGAVVGYLIYRTGSTFALHWFLVVSTCFLFLIGAGLMSKAVWFLQYYRFAKKVGGDVAETGNGPGSYQVQGNVWHLTYGNPEPGAIGSNGFTQLANAIVGWNNDANLGSILSYVFYWIAVMGGLYYNKWSEGRCTFFGRGSAAYNRRMERRAEKAQMPSRQLSPEGSGSEAGSHGKQAPLDEISAAPLLLRDNRTESYSADDKFDKTI